MPMIRLRDYRSETTIEGRVIGTFELSGARGRMDRPVRGVPGTVERDWRGGGRSPRADPVIKVVGWDAGRIRRLFASHGLSLQEWDKARTDWVTLRDHSDGGAAVVP